MSNHRFSITNVFESAMAMVVAMVIFTNANLFADENTARTARSILSNNCFQCHGPDEQERKADLRLDTPAGIASVLDSDDLADSEILRRIISDDADELMPPASSKKTLTKQQIETLSEWVASGAKSDKHWSFAPIEPSHPPQLSSKLNSWVRNPIDAFIANRLSAKDLTPSAEASRSTLIRRLYLDLLGLLPSPSAVERFEANKTPAAFEKLIDEVLASPRFGERWGRHWLDQARYADSDGYSIDGKRDIWPYRDWVIRAINSDMPFSQFTIEQLAGDLLPDATTEQLVATGFHRNTLVNQEGGSDAEQFRIESVVDRVNTTGAVWLGLTIGCAQCHTHKFDPITHHDYYRMFAFFNSGEDKNQHDPRIVAVPQNRRAELDELRSKLAAARDELKKQKDAKLDTATAEARVKALRRETSSLENRFGRTMVMRDLKQARDSFVLVRGDFLRRGDQVRPAVPAVLSQLATEDQATRLDLAKWLVDDRNPLTARVTVNRIWMQYFGRGLVETENDFGVQGTRPTHPQLLDWLASELIRHDWSLKSIHRLIATSATYRQRSEPREDLLQTDANNLLLARQTRLRVTAETVRDLALSASGILSNRIGGQSVYPPQPSGVFSFTQNKKSWKVSSGANRFRRGMYTFFYRSAPHPFLATFDTPNFQTTCTKRLRSNTPLQSLTLANDEAVLDASRGLAQFLLQESQVSSQDPQDSSIKPSEESDNKLLAVAFQRCLTRKPTHFEADRLLEFTQNQRVAFRADSESARQLADVGSDDQIEQDRVVELATWISVSRVLLNLDEFVTRN